MTPQLDDENAAWRRCELAWSAWLQASSYAVTHLGEAVGNSNGTRAPLIAIAGKRLRAPDMQTVKSGMSEYWEVKFRARPDVDLLTGEREHWVAFAAFSDYVAVSKSTGCTVWIVLFEAPTATSPGRWLRADVNQLSRRGRKTVRFGQGGEEVDAWVWPASAMDVVTGPPVDLSSAAVGLLPPEGENDVLDPVRLEAIERQLRKNALADVAELAVAADAASTVLAADPSVALDVLCRSLGLPALPRYSVLRVGIGGIDVDEVLGMLHYGIRVFLITEATRETSLDPTELQAFRDSRLLEWAVVGEGNDGDGGHWVIDGAVPAELSDSVQKALKAADGVGGMNVQQYEIVHAPANSDLLISAGAGTGKTETMSERVIFLLATCRGVDKGQPDIQTRPYDLRADDIVLVTFTRDAALEMRQRISRTLVLRQRLCRRCVLPTLAWMMQLSGAEITTIHSYAKGIVRSGGAILGLAPEFAVGLQTMAFRAILHDALSPHLTEMIERRGGEVPPSHLWQRHIRSVWEALENNGVELMSVVNSTVIPDLDWGSAESTGIHAAVEATTRSVIDETAGRFRAFCLENQSIPTSQLVPFALRSLCGEEQDVRVKPPRYLFVDEFQDTDALQMDLILQIKARLGSNFFVVGDSKQGIYRFRGAEGNAFKELHSRVVARQLAAVSAYPLTRNFRSGARLLESLHPHFANWESKNLLDYPEKEKLRPQVVDVDGSSEITFTKVQTQNFASLAAVDVIKWRAEDPDATIAILCRQNWQALRVRSEVLDAGEPCELLVGGRFFLSPAVRELDVLLRTIANPSDDAALLQLLETRWAAGILQGQPPFGISSSGWGEDVSPPRGWNDRIGTLAHADSYDRSDLEPLRRRLASLAALMNKMPVVALVVECSRAFIPEAVQVTPENDDSERRRYARCFDHLITLLDTNLQEGPTSLDRIVSWLQLQIATNRSEDEPIEWDALRGRTVALTVHKAKGLEFDRVLVPHTWAEFGPPKNLQTRAAVLRGASGPPRLVWQWSGGTNTRTKFTNVGSGDQQLWASDDRETAREEARLLYVALTRAKEQLLVYLPARRTRANGRLSSWADLLTIGEATNG
ncbi:ATP-dependent helicase [Arthrobacter sp. BE255]|uniref:UvrD-helicase domain-containing protein n=1 Tax=Arthrobacter sp. BE255 TaxID=2817721 RepID=UPI002855CA62|nr:ATP-dependent helicase [Arthrobacter sp. BE255]MDR7161384.1 superfamily I DNA/RNA helicase [Arthrobacter sp. BE255]